jgi:hypothetical protein
LLREVRPVQASSRPGIVALRLTSAIAESQ